MRSLGSVLLAISFCASTATAQATLVYWTTYPSSPHILRTPAQFRSISDLDGDGRRDFLFHNRARCWAESSRDVRKLLRTYTPAPGSIARIENVAPIADLDGDGVEDVVLTLVRGLQPQGGVRVISGLTGAPLLNFSSPLGEASTPTRAESADDVDGDGLADLAVEFVEGAGAQHFVRIHSGASGAPLRSYAGRYWFQVKPVGDLNGDGHADLLVGGAGSARVHSGADNSILRDLTVPASDPNFGYFVRRGCDHDGDGFPELLVLAGLYPATPQWHVFSSASSQLLHTLSPLGPSGWPIVSIEHATCCGDVDRDGVADYTMRTGIQGVWRMYSTATSQYLGPLGTISGNVDDLGDMNGDGFDDLGSTNLTVTHGFTLQGAVLLGQSAAFVSCTPAPPPGTEALLYRFTGGSSLSIGDRVVSSIECAPHGSRALFVVGTANVSHPFGLTTLCVGERRTLFATERIDTGWSSCAQYFEHRWSRERLTALGVAPGDTLHSQFVLLDPSAAPSARVRTSNAIAITFAP